MKHLCIRTENDVRLANEIYRKLTENSTDMVFLSEHHNNKVLIFGYNAYWLRQLIEEIRMSSFYPMDTLDNFIYYKIDKNHMYPLISIITDKDIKFQII